MLSKSIYTGEYIQELYERTGNNPAFLTVGGCQSREQYMHSVCWKQLRKWNFRSVLKAEHRLCYFWITRGDSVRILT